MLQEGDIIILDAGTRVYMDAPKHIIYFSYGDWELTHGEVEIGSYNILAGKYVVYKTSEDGGGIDGYGERWNNGHHVFCQHVQHPNLRVDFYETGSFTCVITGLVPIGRARAEWVVDDA